jgi:hypothetical protein
VVEWVLRVYKVCSSGEGEGECRETLGLKPEGIPTRAEIISNIGFGLVEK